MNFLLVQDVLPSPPRRTRPLMKNAGGGPVHIQPSAPVPGRVLRSSRSPVEGPGSWRLRVGDSEGSSDHDEDQTESDPLSSSDE